MVSSGDFSSDDGAHEPTLARRHRLQRVLLERCRLAALAALEPVRGEFHILARQAGRTERMNVGVPGPGPVLELDSQLEGRLGLANDLVLIDPQHLDEADDRWDGRLADPDGADLGGFDQPDATVQIPQQLGEARRGHPPGGSAADDDDAADWIDGHGNNPYGLIGSSNGPAGRPDRSNNVHTGLSAQQ